MKCIFISIFVMLPILKVVAQESMDKIRDKNLEESQVVQELVLLPINSVDDEFSLNFMNEYLFFVSNRREINNEERHNSSFDLFRAGGNKEDINLFTTKINSHKDEGAFSFFDQGNQLIFSRNDSKNRLFSKMRLYHSIKDETNGKWSKPKALVLGAEKYSYGHPVVADEGNILYFSSNMEGTLGGADIFRCEWLDGSWSNPVHLNKVINSQGDEFPSYCDQEGTLYFSSNGKNGKGGHDIFKANRVSDTYKLSSFDTPINSAFDEFGFTMNEDRILLASNREGGKGGFDLYEVVERQIKTEAPKSIYNKETSEEKYKVMDLISVSTLKTTEHWLIDKEYLKPIDSKSFPNKIENIKIRDEYVLTSIFYDLEQYEIEDEQYVKIKPLINLLKKYSDLSVEIIGFTDCTGSFEFNKLLAEKRAKFFKAYLIENNIRANRIMIKGNLNITDCDIEMENSNKRRSDIKLIELGNFH